MPSRSRFPTLLGALEHGQGSALGSNVCLGEESHGISLCRRRRKTWTLHIQCLPCFMKFRDEL